MINLSQAFTAGGPGGGLIALVELLKLTKDAKAMDAALSELKDASVHAQAKAEEWRQAETSAKAKIAEAEESARTSAALTEETAAAAAKLKADQEEHAVIVAQTRETVRLEFDERERAIAAKEQELEARDAQLRQAQSAQSELASSIEAREAALAEALAKLAEDEGVLAKARAELDERAEKLRSLLAV